jgi:hypothetical protein
MSKDALKPSRRGGISTPEALHKAITVRYYVANRSHHLVINKEDVEWLGLESGEELVVNFQAQGGFQMKRRDQQCRWSRKLKRLQKQYGDPYEREG